MNPYAIKILDKLTDKELVIFFFYYLCKMRKKELMKMRNIKDFDKCLDCIDKKFETSKYYIIKRDHDKLVQFIQEIFCD